MIDKIFVVTSNKYKKWEFHETFVRYLPKINIAFKSQKFHESCCVSPEENVRNKALQAFKSFKKPVLIDDTLFFLNKYNDFPGMHAKWLMNSIGINGILRLTNNGDKALFRSYLGFYDGKILRVFKGEINGRLLVKIDRKKMRKGLDYSALFVPRGEKIPMADFYKSCIFFNSHRARAVKKFSRFFKKYHEYN